MSEVAKVININHSNVVDAASNQCDQVIILHERKPSNDDINHKTTSSIETPSKLPVIRKDVKKISQNIFFLRSKNHEKLAHFLIKHGPEFAIPQSQLSRLLNIEIQAVKRGLEKFSQDGFADHEAVCDESGRRTTLFKIINPDLYDIKRIISSFNHISPPSSDRQIENNSFYLSEKYEEKRLVKINDEDFQIFWPHLLNKGFGSSQIKQIVKARVKTGKSLSKVLISLNYIEFELQNGICLDSKGNEFSRPGAFFNALLRHGEWRKPKGFKTDEEQVKEKELAEQVRLAEMDKKTTEQKKRIQKKDNEQSFFVWKDSLSDDKITEYTREWQQKNSHLPANMERILKLAWRNFNAN